jgi:hypothetical protein
MWNLGGARREDIAQSRSLGVPDCLAATQNWRGGEAARLSTVGYLLVAGSRAIYTVQSAEAGDADYFQGID